MAESGNSKHRTSMSGLKVQEESKWGEAKAEQRYGPLQYRDGAPMPKDMSQPQRLGDANNLRGPDWADDHPNDWVRGFGKNGRETAETKPSFDSRGKDGMPKKW